MRLRQTGASLPGVLIIVVLVGMVGLLGIKLFPAYYQDFKVKSALDSLAREETRPSSPADVRNRLLRRLQVDSVNDVRAEHVSVARERGVFVVDVTYEVRQSWFANIDLVTHFDHRRELAAQ